METTRQLPLPLRNIWRAHVTPPNSEDEITVFVEAGSREKAHNSMRHVVAALFPDLTEKQTDNAYYNLWSAAEMVDFGVSANVSFRLFEAGYEDGRLWSWERKPIFVVHHLSAIYDVWQEAIQTLL